MIVEALDEAALITDRNRSRWSANARPMSGIADSRGVAGESDFRQGIDPLGSALIRC